MTDKLPDRALSIRQPWAWAIICEGKDIENRTWKTKFRGNVCIHASKGMSHKEYDECLGLLGRLRPYNDFGERNSHHFRYGNSPQGGEARGGIIGVATITDCVTESDSPWFFGRYGFVLENIRPVPFIPVKGALGFFKWRGRQILERE